MSETETILVVDDEPVNFQVLEAILQRSGYAVLTAENGPEGRRLAGERQPNMILLDVMMPDESGFDTCIKLKENPETAEIPVIFLTCLDDVSNKINGLNLGAVDYVTKPFHADEVLARIRAHLGFKSRQQAIIDAQAHRLGQVKSAQRRMLVRPEQMPEAAFGVSFVPVLEAGGDFYDVISLSPGVTGYFVADVSGHDLGAGFVTSSLKALFRQNAGPDMLPEQTLRDMNAVLQTITPQEMFLTAVYLVLDRRAGRVRLASAGHPPVVSLTDGRAGLMEASGDVIGMFETVELGLAELAVAPGDRFFLYTDGLVEKRAGLAASISENLARLQQACLEGASLPVQECVDDVARAVLDGQAPDDDVVLLGVEA